MQELFPQSGVYLPLHVVLNAYLKAGKDANKLFHKLFDLLFKEVQALIGNYFLFSPFLSRIFVGYMVDASFLTQQMN